MWPCNYLWPNAEPSRQPIIVPNFLNGQSVLRFEGEQVMSSPAVQLFDSDTSELTVSMVFEADEVLRQRFLLNFGAGAGDMNMEIGEVDCLLCCICCMYSSLPG